MPWPPLAQPRRKLAGPRRRLPAMLTSFALLLPVEPAQAGAPATQICLNDMDAAPPIQALALKNAGQELRVAGSFLRASECFRLAVQELPDCATYADERLRWSLWAAENFERAGPGTDPELRAFLEHQVAQLGATPEGAALRDYPELLAARDRQRAAEPASPARPASPPPPRRASRVGAALMAGAAPLVITGGVLAGIYDARSDRLSEQLATLDWASKNGGCTSAPQPGESGHCANYRSMRDGLNDDRLATTRGFITGITLVGVGAGLLLAGLVTHLQGRAERRTASLRLLPARDGLVLHGQF